MVCVCVSYTENLPKSKWGCQNRTAMSHCPLQGKVQIRYVREGVLCRAENFKAFPTDKSTTKFNWPTINKSALCLATVFGNLNILCYVPPWLLPVKQNCVRLLPSWQGSTNSNHAPKPTEYMTKCGASVSHYFVHYASGQCLHDIVSAATIRTGKHTCFPKPALDFMRLLCTMGISWLSLDVFFCRAHPNTSFLRFEKGQHCPPRSARTLSRICSKWFQFQSSASLPKPQDSCLQLPTEKSNPCKERTCILLFLLSCFPLLSLSLPCVSFRCLALHRVALPCFLCLSLLCFAFLACLSAGFLARSVFSLLARLRTV